MSPTKKILLIKPPVLWLKDENGNCLTDIKRTNGNTFQPLIGSLESAGYIVEWLNMREGNSIKKLGTVLWNKRTLSKMLSGMEVECIPLDSDVYGITSNFHMEREAVLFVIKHLARLGKIVVVGGSDAISEPHVYIEAGATVVVYDKSGGSNAGALEVALTGSTDKPCRLYTAKGFVTNKNWRLHPNDWSIPSVEHIKGQLEPRWRTTLPTGLTASLSLCHGCERHCDFCMTGGKLYRLGYQAMNVDRVRAWLEAQKGAGARTVNCMSDQFLGRLLKKRGGREEVLQTMEVFREVDLYWMWRNGLEISKLTLEDGVTPDRELVNAMYGPSCTNCFIPLERPLDGTWQYDKLMQWNSVVSMCEAIVESGAPDLLFGVIIGLREDSHESMQRLDDALFQLRDRLLKINPNARVSFNPTMVMLFPGIPLTEQYKRDGYMPANPDSILITKSTPITGTAYLSIDELSALQRTLCENHVDVDEKGVNRWVHRGVQTHM